MRTRENINQTEGRDMIRIKTAVESLSEQFPNIHGIKAGTNEDSIHLGDVAEGGLIDDMAAANYYAEDYKEVIYCMGFQHKLNAALNELGFFAEWNNPGEATAYRS